MLKFFLKLVLLMFAVAIGRFAYEKVIDFKIFELRKLEVRGNCGMSVDSIMTVAGLQQGKSIYRQNLNYAVKQISKLLDVTSCSIDRGLISSIDIEIETAEPALLLRGEKLYCVSREGIVLPFDENIPVLPIISGKRFSGVKLFDRLKDPDVVYALELYQNIMAVSPNLCARLSEINFGYDSQIRVYLSPGGIIAVLNKRHFEDAVRRLATLHENGLLEGKKIFDLRFGAVAVESSLKKGIL